MTIQEAAQKIIKHVGNRRAYIEILIGQIIMEPLNIGDNVCIIPLDSIGNTANIEYGNKILNGLGIPTDPAFQLEAQRQGKSFNSSIAMVFTELSDGDFENAASGRFKKILRYRTLLTLYTGGSFTPIIRIQWFKPKLAHVEFVAPQHRMGLQQRHADDPISARFLLDCGVKNADDDQLHYFISLLEQAGELKDEDFRIARMYSLLETIASSITSQFERQSDGRPMTRTAIRFMTGYFIEFDIPKFTVGEKTDFEFDHIELAGHVRHKIFHGGNSLQHCDVPVNLRTGVDLLHHRPDLISHALRRDCEQEIYGWAKRESKAWLAQSGVEYTIPIRDPNYDGRSLTKRLIASPAPIGSPIGSVNVKVYGNDIGVIRLQLTQV